MNTIKSFDNDIKNLIAGKLDLNTLTENLDALLAKEPKDARTLLIRLDELLRTFELDTEHYVIIKRKINDFRRENTSATENIIDDHDQTIFEDEARSEQVEDTATKLATMDEDSESTTQRLPKPDTEKTQVLNDDKDIKDPKDPDQKTERLDDTYTIQLDSHKIPSEVSSLSLTSADWIDPTTNEWGSTRNIGVGSIIKERFELMEVLGIGGMGKVYKGVDLLKKEAQDKNPYCAIKLLNEDFKQHPESFIALQRESSRQQRLAHPNIATVYDFDRLGGTGTPVYITMEFMDGQPLNTYIKKELKKTGGAHFEKAYTMIKDMGAALIYAHDRGIVHSDFKPGNAFLLKSGTVKVIDFGIARAVKNPVTGETEKTLFDPGKLGALTPTYASLEMLEGKEPDPRDDIYALGCTSYELLTGKHPFSKLPANKARDNGLAPPYIKTLNKKQNRALQRSIAFEREDRSQNVASFLEELEGKATWYKNPFAIAAGILLIITLSMVNPTLNYLHKLEIDNIITDINVGAYEDIKDILNDISIYKHVDQVRITQATKPIIEKFFREKLGRETDTNSSNYNFQLAAATLKDIDNIYPGSIFLQTQMQLVGFRKKSLIADLNKQYIAATTDKTKIQELNGILDTIRKIDPQHPLLEDPRAGTAYRALVNDMIKNKDLDAALKLVNTGLEVSINDERLLDMKANLEELLRIQKLEEELLTLQIKLASQSRNMEEKSNEFGSLEDYKETESSLAKLYTLKPNNQLLRELSQIAQPLAKKDLAKILKSGNRNDAEKWVAEYEELFQILSLHNILTEAKLAHLTTEERTVITDKLIQQNSQAIEESLAQPEISNSKWNILLLNSIGELRYLAKIDPNATAILTGFEQKIIEIYNEEANNALEKQRFDSAENIVSHGELLVPGKLQATRDSIISRKQEAEKKERIQANKLDLVSFADADDILEARRVFKALQLQLPVDDIYITTEAPTIIATSFARLAKNRAEQGDFEAAYKLTREGLQLSPNDSNLASIASQYEAEANISELNLLFKTGSEIPKDTASKINQIQNFAAPGRAAEFTKKAAKLLVNRINTLKQTNEIAAASMALNAVNLFPSSIALARLREDLQLKPWPQYAYANGLLSITKLTEAMQLRESATVKFSTHPQFIAFSQALDQRIGDANGFYELFLQDKKAAKNDYDLLRQAKILLGKARSRWIDNPKYEKTDIEISKLIEENKPVSKPKIRTLEQYFDLGKINKKTNITGSKTNIWTPIKSENNCTKRLSGFGKRARAICFDMLHEKARGPYMVVLPINDVFSNGFAISKYEISVSDWSKYCILSKACLAITDKERKNEPLTSISIKEVKQYTKWLSERTNKTYRLPTLAEWRYAAQATGKKQVKNFNCRVIQNDNVIKGSGKISVRSGMSNDWGLKNHIGNIQEWVIEDEGGFSANGGAYSDPYAKCNILLTRPHKGEADNITGFRIVLEELD